MLHVDCHGKSESQKSAEPPCLDEIPAIEEVSSCNDNDQTVYEGAGGKSTVSNDQTRHHGVRLFATHLEIRSETARPRIKECRSFRLFLLMT